MTAEGHFIFALASTILAKKTALSLTLNQGDWWHLIAGGLLTCLLPDIDHPSSVLGQRLSWLSIPIFRIFGHRGFTHSLLAIGILLFILQLLPIMLIPSDVCHGMVIGYLSHIIADMLTPAGVPLFWPCRWRFRVPIIIVTKKNQLERLICILLLIFALQYQQKTSAMLITEKIKIFWQQVYGNLVLLMLMYEKLTNLTIYDEHLIY